MGVRVPLSDRATLIACAMCPERSRTLLGHSRDLSQGERANMWTEVLLPAQCLVMGGRGPLRPHSAAERSADTTWYICRERPPPPAGRRHRVLRTPWVGCAREPATVRVLSVNTCRLLPEATKSAPARSRNSRKLPTPLGRCHWLRLVSRVGRRAVHHTGGAPHGRRAAKRGVVSTRHCASWVRT